jgi:hypothetical protein
MLGNYRKCPQGTPTFGLCDGDGRNWSANLADNRPFRVRHKERFADHPGVLFYRKLSDVELLHRSGLFVD